MAPYLPVDDTWSLEDVADALPTIELTEDTPYRVFDNAVRAGLYVNSTPGVVGASLLPGGRIAIIED